MSKITTKSISYIGASTVFLPVLALNTEAQGFQAPHLFVRGGMIEQLGNPLAEVTGQAVLTYCEAGP